MPSSNPHLQYTSGAILRNLNKAYTGFLCQEDRGDISTEKLTLSVKRGSLAFAAEEYPAFSSRMNTNSASFQEGPVSQQSPLAQNGTPRLKISTSLTDGDDSGGVVPLSPIPESCESPGVFQAALVGNILMGGVKQFADANKTQRPLPENGFTSQVGEKEEFNGGIEEFAARMACNLVATGGQVSLGRECLTPSPIPPIIEESGGEDKLASHLAATIINSSLGERMKSQAWAKEQEENRKNAEMMKEKNIEETSATLAKSIISDALFRGDHVAAALPGNISSSATGNEAETSSTVKDSATEVASRLTGAILSEAVRTGNKVASMTHPPIVVPVDRRGSIESFRSSRSSSLTGQSITVLDYTEDVTEEVIRDGLSMAQFMLQGIQGQNEEAEEEMKAEEEEDSSTLASDIAYDVVQEGIEMFANCTSPIHVSKHEIQQPREIVPTFPESSPPADRHEVSKKPLSPLETEEEEDSNTVASDIAYDVVQEGIEMFASCTSPIHVSKHEIQQPREIVPTFPESSPPVDRRAVSQKPLSSLLKLSKGNCRPNQPLEVGDSESELPTMPSNFSGGAQGAATPMNQRLLTPMSVRTGYAWSTASTQDEESRPVSPMDMNKIGLSLSTNTEEFSSLVSEMVISHAIGDATGSAEPSLSPKTINSVDDTPAITNSSKIGLYLSQLCQAEPPCDTGLAGDEGSADGADENGLSSFSSLWDRMRLQLLRPITTGNWGCGPSGGGDPQLIAMIQWVAASACGRPKFIYCTTGEKRVKQVSE